jgi:C-terminal processing protease CtpA/Prc
MSILKYQIMKRIFFVMLVASLIAASCKKEEIKPVTNTTTAESQARDALYNLMQEWYLWYKQMPVVTLADYKDPYELINAVRYKTVDRWSFVADYNAFIASMQGSFVGHGIRMGLDAQKKARVVLIYKNSPLYANGVRRGWIIKTINGGDLASVLMSGNATEYYNLIGESKAGVTNTFVFQTPEGKDSTITTTKSTFQVNSVLTYKTLNLSSGKTGYLAFNEFIEPSSDELKTAFQYLKQEGVKDLILDLRYNTGGILSVATELASYIAGKSTETVLVKSDYNDKKASNNETTYFSTMLYPLNLTRLVVISTRETASASEVVINGLKPFMSVVTIGDTTNGKPTGMNVWGYNNKYVYAPVTFRLVNSAGQGDFYSGFPPLKYVPDDITHDFGDPNESCLKESIYYMEHGSVSSKGAYIYTRNAIFSERPDLLNNTYTVDPQLLRK